MGKGTASKRTASAVTSTSGKRASIEPEPQIEVETDDGSSITEQEPTELSPVELDELDLLHFLEGRATEKPLTLFVYLLPQYFSDPRTSTRTTERMFITSFPFTIEVIDRYPELIQLAHPEGGVFQLEARARGRLEKRWEEHYGPHPEALKIRAAMSQTPPLYPPVSIINQQPAAATTEAPQAPPPRTAADAFKDHAMLMREAIGLWKEVEALRPAPPPPPVPPSAPDFKSELASAFMKRVFDSGDDSQIDKAMQYIFGDGKPSGLVEQFAPVLVDTFRVLAPLAAQKMVAGNVPATTTTNQGALTGAAASLTSNNTRAQPEVLFQRTVQRMIEDCLSGRSHLPSSEALIDLWYDFEELKGGLTDILERQPGEVFQLAAGIMAGPEDGQVCASMSQHEPFCDWLRALQDQTKETLSRNALLAQQQAAATEAEE